MKSFFAPVLAFVSALMLSVPAFAAVDAGVITEITTAKTDVMVIGALVFGIAIAVALYKWFRRAL